jgi:hypothetical protein
MENRLIFLEARITAIELMFINSESLKSQYLELFKTVKDQVMAIECDSPDSQILAKQIEQHLELIQRL